MPMIQNEPFLELKLAPKDAGAGLPPAIPPGLRAVSVKVNEVIGVAGYVLPGTHVDVVATVSPTQKCHRRHLESDSHERPGARGRHQDRTGREGQEADRGQRRHDARRSRAGGAADAREHRRQDSARAAQSARQDHAADPRHQDRRHCSGPRRRRREPSRGPERLFRWQPVRWT